MLNRPDLVRLYRDLRGERVLSVYIDGNQHDFSERNAWRRRLENESSRVRRELNGAGADGAEGFEAAWNNVVGALEDYGAFIPERGWTGFATPSRLVHGSPVRIPLPDLVRWKEGMCVAPYVRALKHDRVVVTALVDARRARLFEYRDGEMSEVTDFLADTFIDDLTDENVSKRATTYTGVRGETGTDAAQKALKAGSEKLAKELSGQLRKRAGKDGFLVIGGPPEAVAALSHHLPRELGDRCIQRSSMTWYMSDAELKAEMEVAASDLNRQRQDAILAETVDQAARGGKGALGRSAVEEALRDKRVDTLLVSRTFVASNPDLADDYVGAAFEEGGEVEELSGEGAERLDHEGEGVGARLRYVV